MPEIAGICLIYGLISEMNLMCPEIHWLYEILQNICWIIYFCFILYEAAVYNVFSIFTSKIWKLKWPVK